MAFNRPRGPRLAVLVALCTVVAVVAGLLITRNGSSGPEGSHQAAAKRPRNQVPFDQALAALATARVLHYKDTAVAGVTQRDITVTPSGVLFGSTGDGVRDLDQDVLRIGGKTYTRWKKAKPYEKPDGKQQDPDAPGTWSLADQGDSHVLNPVLAQFLPPAELAAELSDAVDELKTLPDPNDPGLKSERVRGVPALRADTPAGSLLISRNKPYRVLRLEPYDLSGRLKEQLHGLHKGASPSAIPQVTTGPLEKGDSQGMDLSPVSGGRADALYDTLETDTRQLADAVDRGVDFTLGTTGGNVDCGPGGCTVNQAFTGRLTSDAKTRLIGGEVTATMRATVTIDGQDAGGCTSSPSTLPITGNTVSGTLSCSDPGAGAVFTAVNAKYKAQAEAESRASGGQPVPYRFPYVATPVIDAAALAVGEVDRLVRQVQRERGGPCATRRNSTTPAAAQFTGDRLTDGRTGDRLTGGRPLEQATLSAASPASGDARGRLAADIRGGRSHHAYAVPTGGALIPVDSSDDDPRSFPNLIHDDKPQWFKPIPPESVLGRSGNYAYVVLENGELVIGKRTAGHVSLARGERVLAAGEFKTKGGEVVYLDNKSGHYRPYGIHAEQAAVSAFNRNGLKASGKYVAAWGRPDC
ncbi:hypothetical protein AB0C96_03180 [Streptomyces sp. NPDC048506]|uniref:hypothetical protein n=1 Tax=Streptomyces sp. NPDC048506 TaxID=3155028 RepID=UPI003428D835